MRLIEIERLDDPRVEDYRGIKDRQLLPAFSWAQTERDDPEAPWGKFMAEGDVVLRHLADQRCRHKTLSVLVTPTRLAEVRPLLERLAPETPVYVAEQGQVNTLAGFPLHRGLMAIAARAGPMRVEEVIAGCTPGRPLVALEDVFNHDNIGGVFRNAAALGAAGVILSPRCADPLYRKAVRVSVGCVLVTPWAYAEEWPGALGVMRRAGIVTWGMTGGGEVELAGAAGRARGKKVAVVLGSEGPGLSEAALGVVDERVRIGMEAGIDSLNVTVAGAIALHALRVGQA